jgi:hypothetical protein
MNDPRPCHGCRRDVELVSSIYLVIIEAETLEPDVRRRLCPRCARAEFRRRRFGPIDEEAREAARSALEELFAADLRIIWLQAGDRHWAVLCRHRGRPPRPSEDIPECSRRA